jgi:hypothetical protein
MCNDNTFEKNKMILQGRIYPAIQECVNNRYKIVLGIFAYYSFIFSSGQFPEGWKALIVNFIVSLIFTGFIIHNLVNYCWNNNEECNLEGRKCKCPTMEIFFFALAFVLIWGAFMLSNCLSLKICPL